MYGDLGTELLGGRFVPQHPPVQLHSFFDQLESVRITWEDVHRLLVAVLLFTWEREGRSRVGRRCLPFGRWLFGFGWCWYGHCIYGFIVVRHGLLPVLLGEILQEPVHLLATFGELVIHDLRRTSEGVLGVFLVDIER